MPQQDLAIHCNKSGFNTILAGLRLLQAHLDGAEDLTSADIIFHLDEKDAPIIQDPGVLGDMIEELNTEGEFFTP